MQIHMEWKYLHTEKCKCTLDGTLASEKLYTDICFILFIAGERCKTREPSMHRVVG